MEETHRGMGITDEEFDAIADHLDTALIEHDVPDDDRQIVLETIESYRSDIVEVPTSSP